MQDKLLLQNPKRSKRKQIETTRNNEMHIDKQSSPLDVYKRDVNESNFYNFENNRIIQKHDDQCYRKTNDNNR